MPWKSVWAGAWARSGLGQSVFSRAEVGCPGCTGHFLLSPPLLLLHNFKFPHCHFFLKNIPVSCYISCHTRLLSKHVFLFLFFNMSRFKWDKMNYCVFPRVGMGCLGVGCTVGRPSLYLPFSPPLPVCSLFLTECSGSQRVCPSPCLTQEAWEGAALLHLCERN